MSAQLLNELADWQHEFDANFEPEGDGWTSASIRNRWSDESRRLIERLRQELPDGVQLVLDLWPLESDS